jgi:hypothetical protein
MDYDAPELPSQFSKVMENLKDVTDTQGGGPQEGGFVIDYRKTVFNGLCAQCAASGHGSK